MLQTDPDAPDLEEIGPGHHPEPLSVLLRRLADGPPGPVRIRDMVEQLGRRAFGPLLFTFAVPNLLPLPPGSSTVLGAPLVIVAPQLALGVKSPWLPRWLAERSIDRLVLKRGFDKLLPQLESLERLLAPRLEFLFGPVGDRLIGLTVTLLAFVLVLPIPLGNLAPAASISALSLGLTQRDGVAALVGYAIAAFSFGLLALSARAVLEVIERLGPIFGV